MTLRVRELPPPPRARASTVDIVLLPLEERKVPLAQLFDNPNKTPGQQLQYSVQLAMMPQQAVPAPPTPTPIAFSGNDDVLVVRGLVEWAPRFMVVVAADNGVAAAEVVVHVTVLSGRGAEGGGGAQGGGTAAATEEAVAALQEQVRAQAAQLQRLEGAAQELRLHVAQLSRGAQHSLAGQQQQQQQQQEHAVPPPSPSAGKFGGAAHHNQPVLPVPPPSAGGHHGGLAG